MTMLEKYLEIFYTIGIQLSQLIVPVLALYIVLSLIGSLILDRR